MAAERRFPAMGTDVEVIVVGDERLLDAAQRRVEGLETRWSRFRADSEVSRLNRAGGEPLSVSADTALLVERAVDAWYGSGGLVDCTVLPAVVAAGYDRSFEQLPPDRPAGVGPPPAVPGPSRIVVAGTHVCLPAGVGFDPGGVGKGLAADLVTAELLDRGAEGACVNVGGDLRVRGRGPRGDGWTISIEHPLRVPPVALVGLHDGAVATSTVLKRTWNVAGERYHHLIDPRTGRPSTSTIALATAVAAEAWRAETFAKTALLAGWPGAGSLPDGIGVELLTIDRDGSVVASPDLGRFTGGGPLPAHILEEVAG